MIRAVAWDIDGTLIDSEPLHQAALAAVSAHHGIAAGSHDPHYLGLPLDLVWQKLRPLFPATLTETAWQEAIVATYLASAPTLVAFPDVIDTMARLHQAGVPQCCVSNSGRSVVDANLAAIGISDFIQFSISRDDVVVGKPDPTPYLEACRRLALPPADVLVIEDSDTGVTSAKAAGCPVMRYGLDFSRHAALAERILGQTPSP